MLYLQFLKTKAPFLNENLEIINEDELSIEDVELRSGNTIKSDEVLDVIKNSETEEDFKEYFYNKYGENDFTGAEMDELVTYWRLYQRKKSEKESKEDKTEPEKENGESESNDE